MAMYSDQSYENQAAPSAEDIQGMMVEKAHELFAVCDVENKGFITKRDMQRLQMELPLSPDQLEGVFDSLDDDGNGYLTLEEFTDGFGSFLGLTSRPEEEQYPSEISSVGSGERVYENDHVDSDGEEEQFSELLSNLNAQGVLEDQDVVKSLWQRLRRDEPELLGNFEEFLSRVTGEIRRTHQDYQSLESALKNKSTTHDEEVKKLYEEMENQIKLEKERILAEEKAREKQLKEEMEKELREKDRQLQEILTRHTELEKRLTDINSNETEYKTENDRLSKEKKELEDELDHSLRSLDESRSYINQLRQQTREDKRDRALAALKITEGIAMERESLVKQLDMLRDMNKRLRDDRDEAEIRRALNGETAPLVHRDDTCDEDGPKDGPVSTSIREDAKKPSPKKKLAKQGSIMSNYFNPDSRENSLGANYESDEFECDDVEIDDNVFADTNSMSMNSEMIVPESSHSLGARYGADSNRRRHVHSSDEDDGAANTRSRLKKTNLKHKRSSRKKGPADRFDSVDSDFDIHTPRTQPVGANSSTEHTDKLSAAEIESAAPERVFKVVFVGDSGVGKSSFIHQFCSKYFKSTFSATIGVDFQVKNLRVDGHIIALQLWDTAGQERFRSITKQYFRKADGVIITYDVTSESSFRSVRNWMTSVQEGTEEGTVLLMVGNKMDLVGDDERRPVTMKDGSHLADEYGALFYETSAKNGLNVNESLSAMASLLREKEDRDMQQALNLDKKTNKERGCCI